MADSHRALPTTSPPDTYRNPRRCTAEQSVCLRRISPPTSIPAQQGTGYVLQQTHPDTTLPNRARNNAGVKRSPPDPSRAAWFAQNNENVATRSMDNEPPFLISALYPSSGSDAGDELASSNNPGVRRSDTENDDLRNIIDDLTVENKQLQQRLRKFERLHPMLTAKETLLEVRMHGLPSPKKRELEEMIRVFVANMDGEKKVQPTKPAKGHSGFRKYKTGNTTTSTTASNHPTTDSGYQSMSMGTQNASAPTPAKPLEDATVPNQSKSRNIKSYLSHLPTTHLPKDISHMTEKQRMKLVVRRLEDLFTGSIATDRAEHSQAVQQQEVSREADAHRRGADSAADYATIEGSREARMMPSHLTLTKTIESTTPSDDSSSHPSSDSSSPDQRPTRPLDLDVDRSHNPADTMDYIRHLGLGHASANDTQHGGGEWVWLNLLISMAQLHTMNVTPEFIRKSVTELSSKFELSEDGSKLRWKGGAEGTRISTTSESEGDGSSGYGFGSGEVSGSSPEDGTPEDRNQVQAATATTTQALSQNPKPKTKLSGYVSVADFHHQNGTGIGNSTGIATSPSKRRKLATAHDGQMTLPGSFIADVNSSHHAASPMVPGTAARQGPTPNSTGLGPAQNNASSFVPYKPIIYAPTFSHRSKRDSGEMSLSSSGEVRSDGDRAGGGGNQNSHGTTGGSGEMDSASRSSQRSVYSDGPVIFYKASVFCTDLSADRGYLRRAREAARSEESKTRERGILGVKAALGAAEDDFERSPGSGFSSLTTDSGFSSPSEPLSTATNVDDMAIDPPLVAQAGSKSPTTTDGIIDEEEDLPKLVIAPLMGHRASSPEPAFIDFEASGIGGVMPRDNFGIRVRTRQEGCNADEAATIAPRIARPARLRLNTPRKAKIGIKRTISDVEKVTLTASELPAPSFLIVSSSSGEFCDSEEEDEVSSLGVENDEEDSDEEMMKLDQMSPPAPARFLGAFSSWESEESGDASAEATGEDEQWGESSGSGSGSSGTDGAAKGLVQRPAQSQVLAQGQARPQQQADIRMRDEEEESSEEDSDEEDDDEEDESIDSSASVASDSS